MLYHASKQAGLKELRPQISTHGKAYVYAINNRLTALLFGAPKDDFDILMDESNGTPVIYECYPDALKSVYWGKSCSLYSLSEDGFLANRTGWDPELVCERAVSVVCEERIENIYEEIIRAIQAGGCIFHPYSEDTEYQDFLRDELSERIKQFGITEAQMQADPRFELYFNRLLHEENKGEHT